MRLKIFFVDAFADQIFQGNPAAVCVLEDWLPDAIMQAVAAEINLSETAFVVPKGPGEFRIRWFTPKQEVELCGHATLASAHVLYTHLGQTPEPLRFHSLSGPLVASPDENGICLDFPLETTSPIDTPDFLPEALGAQVKETFAGKDLIVFLSDASEVVILEPNLSALASFPYRGICVTAPGNGNGFDFVCRFFAPSVGINEDPVTGSAYTKLVPIYAGKTGKREFKARQVSARSGDLHLSLQGDRVFISGNALTTMSGEMNLPDL